MKAHASNTRRREQEHQAVVRHFIPPISMTVCQVKGSTPKLKQTNWFVFWLFPGRDRPPSGFSWFSQKNHLKTSKTCGVVTAMVFKPLL